MDKLKLFAGALLPIILLCLTYSYIQTQRQLAENGRFQQQGNHILDTRTGEAYRVNNITGETKKINQPIETAH